MQLVRCVKCEKLFYSDDDLCPSCFSRDLKDLEKVRKFVLENPQISSLSEISEKTEVSKKDILRYISNGKFDDVKHLDKQFSCSYCHTPISKGKYCNKCLNKFYEIRNELLSTNEKKK